MNPHLRIGFMPLVDCAPFVVAQEKGFFHTHGLEVSLHKAQSWSQVLERLVRGDLEAAHMLLTMPLKWAADARAGEALAYAFATSGHGHTVVVSNAFWRAGGRDAAGLAAVLRTRAEAGMAPMRMAVVFPHSTHEYMGRLWLERAGVRDGHEVTWSYVSPPHMVHALREGNIDGFIAGEPWGQRATLSKLGYIVTSSRDILPPLNDKVLGVRARWHQAHPDVHAALLRALWDASAWLATPAHLDEAAVLVAGKRYVNTTPACVHAALEQELHAGGHRTLRPKGFLQFAGDGACYPDPNHARFYLERMWRAGHVTGEDVQALDLQAVCLESFYRDVLAQSGLSTAGRLPEHPGESYAAFLQRFPSP
ncbi:MAG TPA: CmpA/NrtA family ABC transporter substrate-binding protein [Fibrobacteria bacterium]|jgi:ABC-type nitrate/sulfonate/bicarbonate transport system substrate-binding protein|nr:CmpA/NrtA family ABC transporter substrate-binding protein [Fibrobacteria bacterium]